MAQYPVLVEEGLSIVSPVFNGLGQRFVGVVVVVVVIVVVIVAAAAAATTSSLVRGARRKYERRHVSSVAASRRPQAFLVIFDINGVKVTVTVAVADVGEGSPLVDATIAAAVGGCERLQERRRVRNGRAEGGEKLETRVLHLLRRCRCTCRGPARPPGGRGGRNPPFLVGFLLSSCAGCGVVDVSDAPEKLFATIQLHLPHLPPLLKRFAVQGPYRLVVSAPALHLAEEESVRARQLRDVREMSDVFLKVRHHVADQRDFVSAHLERALQARDRSDAKPRRAGHEASQPADAPGQALELVVGRDHLRKEGSARRHEGRHVS